MRIIVTALLVLLAWAAWGQPAANPYVLDIDRTPYTLALPAAAVAAPSGAGAGATAMPGPQAPSNAALHQRAREIEEMRRAQYEQERRMAELARERDAWKTHAERLEAQIQSATAGRPLLVPPAPMR